MKSIATFGEIMLRLTPPNYGIIEDTYDYLATFGGTEANVAISLAQFGHSTKFISKLPDNQLGEAAIKYLNANKVNTEEVIMNGENIGIYFLETGFGIRPSKVLYNRKNSSMTTIQISELQLDKAFKDVSWFHFSGITLALSESVRNTVYDILKYCKVHQIYVSFDCNYRKTLWTIEEARYAYKCIEPYVDLFFATAFDAIHFFDVQPDNSLSGIEKDFDVLKRFICTNNSSFVFGYQRNVFAANENSIQAYAFTKDELKETKPMRFQIYDRIGSGDAFAAGVIHGLMKTNLKDIGFALEFGLKASILKHTLWGDAFKLSEKYVLKFMENESFEVSR